MIASMFNLEDRLAELRPSEAEHRVARQLRETAFRAGPARAAGGEPRWSAGSGNGSQVGRQPSRAVAR